MLLQESLKKIDEARSAAFVSAGRRALLASIMGRVDDVISESCFAHTQVLTTKRQQHSRVAQVLQMKIAAAQQGAKGGAGGGALPSIGE